MKDRKRRKIRSDTLPSGYRLDDDLTVIEHLGGTEKVDLYLCQSKQQKDLVACKILTPKYRERKRSLKALKEEGEILLRLSHPHVVGGFGYSMDDIPRIAMEFLEGQTLRTIFLKGNFQAFDVGDIVEVVDNVAEGLEYVHSRGVLHLDLKPSNVMYLEGHATLFDFSVAELYYPNEELYSDAGTHKYMAPEQTYNTGLSYATDVFGLGVLFYEIITGGKMPYSDKERDSEEEKRVDYETSPNHPSLLNPDVPRGLGDVAMKAISPNTADRYRTPAEFREALLEAWEASSLSVADSYEAAEYSEGLLVGTFSRVKAALQSVAAL